MIRMQSWPVALLVIVPIAPALRYLTHASPIWTFLTAAAAIAVLANWIRRATEHVASQIGPAIGGLLTISFGSFAELILAVFVLASGKADVVRAQITGSIIGTSLFALGLAIVVGSIGRAKQIFKRERAGQLSSLLILVVIALMLPAERTEKYLFALWTLIDEILNSVLFLLIGLEVLILRFQPRAMLLASAIIPIVLLARFLAVSAPPIFFAWTKLMSVSNIPFLTWAGVRGGISVALALSIPDSPAKPTILAATYAIVLFSILVQGSTLKYVAKHTISEK
jgi:NhaP-type Na+/H+ or K+/H+ antiporter